MGQCRLLIARRGERGYAHSFAGASVGAEMQVVVRECVSAVVAGVRVYPGRYDKEGPHLAQGLHASGLPARIPH